MIVLLPVAAHWCALLVITWLVIAVRQVCTYRHRCRQLVAISLASSGRVTATASDGRILEVVLADGSMVQRHFAWLRLRFDAGHSHGELLSAAAAGESRWHRLQLLWSLSRGAFSERPGAC